MSGEARLAALNNAGWYEAVFRAHGLGYHSTADLWLSFERPPAFHSNCLVLSPDHPETHLSGIRRLADRLDAFSVKDGFALLDLAPLGFRPLFNATWIWREPDSGADGGLSGWRRLSGPRELAGWEAAWRDGEPAAGPGAFVPALLADPAMALFGRWQDGALVAGCAANRSGPTVGFSNFFAPAARRERDRAAAIAATAAFAAGRPVVGYERGDDLDGCLAAGFRPVGPLRVWLRDRP